MRGFSRVSIGQRELEGGGGGVGGVGLAGFTYSTVSK